jgi:AMMECR1 domain-containing protein
VEQLRPGVDGLIIEEGFRRGTFLPSVWEQLPDAREFLRHLKLKAGLPVNYWSETVQVSRYTTHGFGGVIEG